MFQCKKSSIDAYTSVSKFARTCQIRKVAHFHLVFQSNSELAPTFLLETVMEDVCAGYQSWFSDAERSVGESKTGMYLFLDHGDALLISYPSQPDWTSQVASATPCFNVNVQTSYRKVHNRFAILTSSLSINVSITNTKNLNWLENASITKDTFVDTQLWN